MDADTARQQQNEKYQQLMQRMCNYMTQAVLLKASTRNFTDVLQRD